MCSCDELYKKQLNNTQQWHLLDILLVYVCLSKNFSMSAEKVAKLAQPIHAAFGRPETKSNSSKSPETQRIVRANKNLLKESMKRSEFQFPEKANYAKKIEKILTRDLQHGARSAVRNGSHRTGKIVGRESPHKAGKIVGCNIVYVMFLIICNSIINQKKNNC
ncbi:hypothetical protein YC2023_072532 [Brassica napus]